MGLRIHRAVGWATTHPDSAALRDRLYEDAADGEVEAFVQGHLRSSEGEGWRLRLELPMNGRPYPLRFSDILHQVCGPDYREADWIIATPGHGLGWFRRDDTIDWAAVRHSPDWEENTIVPLPGQPYPYNLGESAGVPDMVSLLAQEFGFDSLRLTPAVATWWR